MLKLSSFAALIALTFAAQPSAAQSVLGPDAAACRGDGPAVLVNVSGFKNRVGRLRINLYGSNPGDFLAKGKKLHRIDLPVAARGNMRVCVKVPKAGNYGIAVRHDADANGKSGWNDGGGFSRNPSISLASLKPKLSQVVIPVSGVKNISVVLQYRRGLAIGPVDGS